MLYSFNIIKDKIIVDKATIKVEDLRSKIKLFYKDSFTELQEEGDFPFVLLKKIRERLEVEGKKIACKGNRLDVYPSGRMLIGFYAYILKHGKQAELEDFIQIFEEETDYKRLSTIREQKENYEKWLSSL